MSRQLLKDIKSLSVRFKKIQSVYFFWSIEEVMKIQKKYNANGNIETTKLIDKENLKISESTKRSPT